jgi:hypothetical protein
MLSDDLCPKPVNIRGEKCSWTMHSQPMPPTSFSNFFFRFLGFLFYLTCGIQSTSANGHIGTDIPMMGSPLGVDQRNQGPS